MAYSDDLAQRVRAALALVEGIDERDMFGGVEFLHHGNVICGVIADDLVVRVGPDAFAEAVARPGAREMTFTGRPMSDMVMVDADAISDFRSLNAWVKQSLALGRTLPPKNSTDDARPVDEPPFPLLPGVGPRRASPPTTSPADAAEKASAKKATKSASRKRR